MRSKKKSFLAMCLAVLMMFQILPINVFAIGGETQAVVKEAIDYALFSASQDSSLSIKGSKVTIKGDVHSNADFIHRGSKLQIEGKCEASGKVDVKSSKAVITKKVEGAQAIEMQDYIEDIKAIASEDVELFEGDKKYKGSKVVLQKSIIAGGNISVRSSKLTSNGYIIAEKDIYFNTSKTESASEKRIVICSEEGNISFKGSRIDLKGIIYAPKGTVTINSAKFSLNGRIIADKIVFKGSSLNVMAGADDLELVRLVKIPILQLVDDNGYLEFSIENIDVAYDYVLTLKSNNSHLEELLAVDLTKPIFTTKETVDGIYQYQITAISKTGMTTNSNTITYVVSTEFIGEIGIDTDGDGIDDETEIQIGTDPLNPDTDEDGLPDGYEYYVLNTSPLEIDTDENGITDGDEDFDNDGLTNYQEYLLTTNPNSSDTDGDMLIDGDEVYKYMTNPLLFDTDADLMCDGDEIFYGTDPLNPDSNSNGIIDGEEKYLTIAETSDEDADPNVKPSVKLELSVDQFRTISVSKYEGDFLADEMPGYIGSAYDFNVHGEIDQAEISFQFNKELLQQHDFQPAIYYYDEENQRLIELPDQRLDLNNGIISVDVEHFSTYILLNKIAFDKVWEEQIRGGNEDGEGIKPLNIVLVIDSSGSMSWNDRYNIRKTAAKEFVAKLGEDDKAAVVDFNGSVKLLTGLTSDKSVLNSAIDRINSSGGTNILPAINMAVQQFVNIGAEINKNIILLSDGDDGTGINSYNTVIQTCISNKITIYTVGLGSEVKANLLTGIATQTGGKYYHATIAQDLYNIYKDVAGETIDYSKDTDGDGISDYNESRIRLGNGIIIKTDPNNPDSDRDGINDGDELNLYEIVYEDHPLAYVNNSSTTSAYLNISYYRYHSNPIKDDTDGDGYSDDVDKFPREKYKTPIILLHGRKNIDGNTNEAYGAQTLISSDKWNNHYIADNIDAQNSIIRSKSRTKDTAWFRDNSKEYYSLTTHKIEKVVNNKEVSDTEIYKDAGKTREPRNLAFSLVNKEKYEINKNLYALNYPNTDLVWKNADLLKWYISELRKNTDLNPTKDNSIPTKFILIGRDSGGLVARYYIENLYGDRYIDRLITIDTEHKGLAKRNESEPIGFDFYGLGKMFEGVSYQAPEKSGWFSGPSKVQTYVAKYQTGLIKPELNTTVPYFRIGTTISKNYGLKPNNLDTLKNPVTNSVKSFLGIKVAEIYGNEYQLLNGDRIPNDLKGVFKNSSTVQSNLLEKISIEAALLAYDDYLRVNRNNKPYYLTKMLKNLGFTNYWKSNGYGNNIEHDISYTIAHRTITEGGTNYNLIAVILRGTDGVEWMGNFDIRKPVGENTIDKYSPEKEEHFSFGYANRVLLEKIYEYCNTYGLDADASKNKIWITGHSRGAAVANLAAAYLTMGKDYKGYLNNRLAQSHNIYAYTFATPNVSTSIQSGNFNNIFNFLNSEDFVTLVPFSQWGYRRYGKDIVQSPGNVVSNDAANFNTNYLITGETKFVAYPDNVNTAGTLFRELSDNTVYGYYNTQRNFYENGEITITTYEFAHDRLASAFQYSHKPFGDEMKAVQGMIREQIEKYKYPFGANSDYGAVCEQVAILSQTDAIAYCHQPQTYYTMTVLRN